MTDRPLRWGILATGRIAAKFTADLTLLPDAEAVAVGSRSAEAAAAFAARYGIPRAHGSWTALAADPEVDAVYVATPHSAHYLAALTCIEAGKAVLVEKPFTLDVPTSAALVEAARRRGTFLMEAMWTRCLPAVRRLAELLADGAVGEVTMVQADFGFTAPAEPDHRLRDPALGGGALLDLGIYPITLAHLALGAPQTVAAVAALSAAGIDTNTGLLLGYPSGAVATLACSIVAATPCTAAISGTAGRIELPTRFHCPSGFTLYRPGHEPAAVEAPFEGWGYHFEAAEVARCLRAGLTESPLVPLQTTLATMAILDTARAQLGIRYPVS